MSCGKKRVHDFRGGAVLMIHGEWFYLSSVNFDIYHLHSLSTGFHLACYGTYVVEAELRIKHFKAVGYGR